MLHQASTIMAKMGVAATFLLGAVASKQMMKHQDLPHIADTDKPFRLTRSADGRIANEKQRSKIVSRIYHKLRNFCLKDNDHTAAKFHIENGRQLCEQYLSERGVVAACTDRWLREYSEAAEWVDTVDYWVHPPPVRLHPSPTYSQALLSGLRALWYTSCCHDIHSENYATDAELINTLKQVLEEKDTDSVPIALKIIANITAMHKNKDLQHDSELLRVLNHCANNAQSHIFLPAWRALHNLRAAREGGEGVYVEGIYPFVRPDEEKVPLVDIVLVHGIRGGASWTWRQHDAQQHKPLLPQTIRKSILQGLSKDDVDQFYTRCWPLDWLVPALGIPARVIAVNYKAGWWRWGATCPGETTGETIATHSTNVAEALKVAGVGQRPIVWICHSMGGLIVKYLLTSGSVAAPPSISRPHNPMDTQHGGASGVGSLSLLEQTMATVFFSVPHHGSPLAASVSRGILGALLRPSTEVYEMRTDNPTLKAVHDSFLDLVNQQGVSVLTLNESIVTQHPATGHNIYFVPPSHGDPGVGEFHLVDATHLDICKPNSRDSEAYQKLLIFLQATLSKQLKQTGMQQ